MSATYSFSSLLQESPKYLKEFKGTLYIVEFYIVGRKSTSHVLQRKHYIYYHYIDLHMQDLNIIYIQNIRLRCQIDKMKSIHPFCLTQ